MLKTIILPRVFILKVNSQEIKLSDPNDRFSREEVLNFYSDAYPILATAKVEGPEIINDERQFRFTTTLGTKG